MARLESTALGGYYKTPAHLLPLLAAAYTVSELESGNTVSFMDPCAGDGEALLTLHDTWFQRSSKTYLYTCELESSRYATLANAVRERSWSSGALSLQGDAFRVTFSKKGLYNSRPGVSLLYLNPPYDLDRVHGRLEEKFLDRFTPTLMDGGQLLFLVPFYALKASAATLATKYRDITCFRFPSEDFEGYKQVALFATKSEDLFTPDPTIVAMVEGWAKDASGLPKLSESTGTRQLPVNKEYGGGLEEWTIRPMDVTTLLGKVAPWQQSVRMGGLAPVPNILPDVPAKEMLLRRYPMATPPRPAHIAAGIASGLFNGARIEPSNPKLPSLLVKGVFDKEYKTVEEKRNKDGDVTAVVQIQQPKLVTTVLDLSTKTYHLLGASETGSLEISKMGVPDVMKHYGGSFMNVMEAQCPILYDPRKDADDIPLPSSPRKPFTAQGHAIRAIIRLLGGPKATALSRRGKAAILLGEIGSGKSTVSLLAGKGISSKRTLVLCPPHLLTSWTNEVASVMPEAEVRILQSVTDVDDIAAYKGTKTIIAVLSRESAKLGHGWVSVEETCPSCGAVVPEGDLAKKRVRCEERHLVAKCPLSKAALSLARKLMLHVPADPFISNVLRGRFEQGRIKTLSEEGTAARVYRGLSPEWLDLVLNELVTRYDANPSEDTQKALVTVLFAANEEWRTAKVIEHLRGDTEEYSYTKDGFIREMMYLLTPGGEAQNELLASFKAKSPTPYSYGSTWTSFDENLKGLMGGSFYGTIGGHKVIWEDGSLTLDKAKAGSVQAALLALRKVTKNGSFGWTPTCGEPLFQAIAEPRRYPLARYITKWHPSLFDYLVVDESHEYSTDGSAQERSAHRLTSLKVPTVLMTGSWMNGYAESMFTNMWAVSPAFREEFERGDRMKFVDRYGYRKRILEDRDRENKGVVTFGSHTDRVERSERVIGNAPGVLPLFLLRHLLPLAVTLHKADLAIDLPTCTQERVLIQPTPELSRRYKRLLETLIKQMKKDQWVEDRAGRLMGMLSEVPSYLDRATADTGNVDNGNYEIRYPESLDNELVALQEPFESDTLLPKEEWLLEKIEKELAEGRNVIVMTWHVTLLPRIARLISKKIGGVVPILYAEKVPTGKRQDWIEREVVKKNRRVLVTNPVSIQTGLNNLVHFATEIWMESPACNPITYRQAIGRIDRIGQKKETRVFFAVYDNTVQVQLYDLLMKKVAVSVSTDGLDPESALRAAGVGEDEYLTGLSIGKQIWQMLSED